MQNVRFYSPTHNETVSNFVCESISYLSVTQANIDMGTMPCFDKGPDSLTKKVQ